MPWARSSGRHFLGLGYVFSGQIERVAEYLASLGGWLLVLLLGVLAAYIAYKFVARQRFLRELRISRITVDELKEKIDSGEELVIVDLRHSMDFEADLNPFKCRANTCTLSTPLREDDRRRTVRDQYLW